MQEPIFTQGEIWLARLDPTEGSEIKKTRPCLVISSTLVNKKLRTVTVVPLSSGKKNAALLLINLSPDAENGLKKDCHLVIPQIRTLAKSRLIKKMGKITQLTINLIRDSFEAYFWDN